MACKLPRRYLFIVGFANPRHLHKRMSPYNTTD
nr:MAG TPA: hypothetical protein [Caudoviricetes sp.]